VVNHATSQIKQHKQFSTDNKSSRYERGSSSVKKDIYDSDTLVMRHFPQIKVNSMKDQKHATLISNYRLNHLINPKGLANRNKRREIVIDDYNDEEKNAASIEQGYLRTDRRMLSNRTKIK
jgi:hypothetical protein